MSDALLRMVEKYAKDYALERAIAIAEHYKANRRYQLQLWSINPDQSPEQVLIEIDALIEKVRRQMRNQRIPAVDLITLHIARKVETGEAIQ